MIPDQFRGPGRPCPGLLHAGAWEYIDVENAEDFGECVRAIKSWQEYIGLWLDQVPGHSLICEITAGTKCMSAALALVARRWECSFSYVGGTARNREGVGDVTSGHEKMHFTENPWNALGYQAIEDACQLFDQYAFGPAVKLLGQAGRLSSDGSVKRTLATFGQLSQGYDQWDRFQHKNAAACLHGALKNGSDLVAALGQTRAAKVRRGIQRNVETLDRIAGNPLSILMVADLIANARRRGEERRFDDGVARLYRAIEALAQVALRERHSIQNSGAVRLEQVPETLREQWGDRVQDGTLRLGLQDDFELLRKLDDPLGLRFMELSLHDHQGSALQARNSSILAHGFVPVSEIMFEKLFAAAIALGEFQEEDLPVVPKLAGS